MENTSEIIFILQGLNESLTKRQVYFALALMSYVFTVCINLILIVTVCLETTLHEPILTVMAYDRYLAVCKPLQYHALMTMRKVTQLLLLTWCFSLLETFVGALLTTRLTICSRYVGKMFCTNWEVVKLSCSDTASNNIYSFVLSFSHLSQTGLILVSYSRLVRASLQSRSSRRKFFQTCLPHLVTLLIFVTSLLFDVTYSRYGTGAQQTLQNVLAVGFVLIPPLINPIIYGIKVQQIRSRIILNFTHKAETLRRS
ncbi:hypothetical protein Q5P01_009470 [Channa striata]|uniref:G-protein coupled receptors family 1 profile domain-containing protein n=1 Tax=Channa striata TaxID=64152 RepID=A0AA88MYW6_CHASR|nr:hypothetical protein Q5P01_009470 [Channa striata]